MAKSKATGAGNATALARWDERLSQLAKSAKQAVSKVGLGGNFISLRGGIMTVDGAAVPENKLRCIVIDAVAENQFYEGAFDPDNFAAPSCYAFGRDPDAMAPNPEDVPEPVNPTCKGCPNNEWGSAEVGKGKACKEVQRLAVIPEVGMGDVENADVKLLKVPVTSTKGWAGYVRQLTEVYNMPPLAFITEISVVKENTNKLPGWHLEFRLVSQIEEPEAFDALIERYDEVSKTITFPYPKAEAQEAAAPAARPAARQARVKAPTRAVPAAPIVGARRATKPAKF